jgi:predicted ribosome quality control (RQC) complex YloA/Tae2 family protein
MDRSDLARRLRSRRSQVTEELGQLIHHIEELEASIQVIEGGEIPAPIFPPQNPFRGVPVPRINTETYLLIAREIIGRQTPEQTRTPGAQKAALLQELEQRRREVRRLIAPLDRELEQLEAQAAQERNLVELYPRGRQVINDRDNLRAELQFYIDLTDALNYTPTRTTPEERVAANQRARTWVENIARRNRH